MKKRNHTITGFRAISLVAVCIFHLYPHRLTGGFLAVVAFFTMAGYFTALPYAQGDGRPLYLQYRSRFLRLMPPLLFMVFSITLFSYFFLPQIFLSAVKYLPGSLFGFNNYAQIWSGLGYFNLHGNFNPFVHLWALSVEMQVYLFLPMLLRGLDKKPRSKKLQILLGISLFSALYIALAYFIKGPDFAYYSSLSRMMSFSVGALFAFLFAKQIRRKTWSFPAKTPLEFLLFFLLILGFFLSTGAGPFLYLGGFLFYSLLCSFLLVLFSQEDGPLALLLRLPVLQYLGSRAYSFYLWQFSLMTIFAKAFAHSTLPYLLLVLLQLLLVFFFTELSYQFFERRKRRLVLPLLLLATLLLTLLPKPQVQVEESLEEKLLKQVERLQSSQKISNDSPDLSASPDDLVKWIYDHLVHPGELSLLKIKEPSAEIKYLKEMNALFPDEAVSLRDYHLQQQLSGIALGDSVMVSGAVQLQKLLPNFLFDASLSRQFYDAGALLEAALKQKPDAKIIVIGLGTNGVYPLEKDMEKIIQTAGSRKILLINTILPEAWESDVNKQLQAFSDKYPQVSILDWYAKAKNKQDYFYDDGTHPNPMGTQYYVQLILKSIINSQKEN